MAKKRVHELAKQYDMPSAEVMKRLNAYGLNVKASASAVDEDEAERALTGKAPKQETNGQPAEQQSQRPAQQTGMGFDRPATDSARQRLAERQKAQQEARAKANQQQQPSQSPSGDGAGRKQGEGGDGQGAERRQRPTRSSLQGERSPGSAGGVRRVVIDSQASRRGPGGPGGPGGGPGMPPRRPPRRGGRRRRGAYVEPAAQDVASLKADVIKINSGS